MQQISGFLTRRALLAAAIAFGVGCIVMIWLLVGTFTHTTQPPMMSAAELPLAEQPVEPLAAEELPAEAQPIDQRVPTEAAETASVVVYVSGAVSAPDVYRLPAGARVKDVIIAAGGFSADADPDAINLAARITDAQQIKVPRRGEVAVVSASGAEPGRTKESELINLNTANAAELDQLPGIGLAIAERIVDYRSTNGPFGSIDDLGNVKGIGTALLEKITPLVTIE